MQEMGPVINLQKSRKTSGVENLLGEEKFRFVSAFQIT